MLCCSLESQFSFCFLWVRIAPEVSASVVPAIRKAAVPSPPVLGSSYPEELVTVRVKL